MPSPLTTPEPPDNLPPRPRHPHPSLRISTGRSTAPDPLPGGRAPDPTPITSSSQSQFSRDIPETQVDELLRPFENQDIHSGPPSAGPSGVQHEIHGDAGSRRSSVPLGESANQERYITRIPEEGEGNSNHHPEREGHTDMDVDVDQTPQPTHTSLPPDREGRSSPDVPRTPISREFSPPTQTDQEQMSSPTFHFESRPQPEHEHRSVPSGPTSPRFRDEDHTHLDDRPNHDETEEEPKDQMRLRGGGPAISAFDRWYSYPEPYNWRGAELHEENMNRVPPDMLPNDPPIVFPNFAQKRAEHLAAQKAIAEEQAKAKHENGNTPAEEPAPGRKNPAETTEDPDIKPYSLDPPISVNSEEGKTKSKSEEELRLRGGGHLDCSESGSSGSPNSREVSPQRFRALFGPLSTHGPEETSTTFRGTKATVPTLSHHYPNDTLLHLQRPIHPTSSGDAPKEVQNTGSPVKWYMKSLSAIKRACQQAVHLLIPSHLRNDSDAALSRQPKSPDRHRRFGTESDRGDDPHLTPTPTPQEEVTSPTASPSSLQETIITTPSGYTVESFWETATSPSTGQKAPRRSLSNPFFSAMTDPGPGGNPFNVDTEGSGDTPSPGPSDPAPTATPAPPAPPTPQPQTHTTELPVPQSVNLVKSSSDHEWRDKLKSILRLPRNRSEIDTSSTRSPGEHVNVTFTQETSAENKGKKKLPTNHRGKRNTKSVQPVPTIPSPPAAAAGPSSGAGTQASRQEDGDGECCPWVRRVRQVPFVPMERSAGQGPTAEIGVRDHRLIAVADYLFPCLRPRAENAKRTVEETVTGEGGSQHGNGSKGKGKGKGKSKGKGKGKGKQKRFGEEVEGSGAGGPSGGEGGDGSGSAGPSGGGSGAGGEGDAGQGGNHEGSSDDKNGDDPGGAGGNGGSSDAPSSPGGSPRPRQDTTTTSTKPQDPSDTLSNEIDPLIGPSPEPKPFTISTSTGGTELTTTKSLKPPVRDPDLHQALVDQTPRPLPRTLFSDPTLKMNLSSHILDFHPTPGTGTREEVPPVPDRERSDEGILRPIIDESGNNHALNPPSPSYLTQQPTHTVFGATTADIGSSTPLPPSSLGIGHPSGLESPKSLLTASRDDPPGSHLPYTQAQLDELSRNEAQRRWIAEHVRNITPGEISPPGGSPLSSGGTSPIALFTSTQLAHPLEVPPQPPSTESRSVFDPQTPPGGYPSGSGLSDITEGSGEGLPSLESSGTVSAESSHVAEPMGSLGQAVQAAEAMPTTERPQEDEPRVRQAAEIEPTPPTPVTRDPQFDERASFTEEQDIGPVTHAPQGYTVEPQPEDIRDLSDIKSESGQQSPDVPPRDESHITGTGISEIESHPQAVPSPVQGGSEYITDSEEEVVYRRRANGIAGDDLAGTNPEEPSEVPAHISQSSGVLQVAPKETKWYKRLWRRVKRAFH
ncbi:hypothetical protein I302_103199 [Kwoniella bestiolae CBS 10118]|uniref:Uncharacterized protein n=1 Tax=Kwoniella bestiolae CBS 10118 TaxID=1296100 RepID=A0A1B9G7T1_9TREE|nr:hypothetical protein I302_01898 [Kwoniella bestiolae CBS 10118]OCF27063.1 hypothetical protein I302_01898 [Kwoniella bestiolae CBS 10118]